MSYVERTRIAFVPQILTSLLACPRIHLIDFDDSEVHSALECYKYHGAKSTCNKSNLEDARVHFRRKIISPCQTACKVCEIVVLTDCVRH